MKLGKCDFRIQGTWKRRESSLSSPTSDPDGKTKRKKQNETEKNWTELKETNIFVNVKIVCERGEEKRNKMKQEELTKW